MKTANLKTMALFVLALTVFPVGAKVKLPSVLDNHMVLQQKSDVRLWGSADPNKKVVIRTSWNGEKYVTKSDEEGRWLVTVRTSEAGGPFEISFDDGEKVTLQDVLLGEVWLCAGQSNMEMPVKGFQGQPIEGSNDVIASANPEVPIRMITIERAVSKIPLDSCKGEWQTNRPESVANISATAYFFADYLHKTLRVPVGIVVSSWGGTKVEPWMSRSVLESFSEVGLNHLDTDGTPNLYSAGCVLHNAMLYPIRNLNLKGMIWYQGESNHDLPELYRRLMPAFVQDMRRLFGIGDFPFYYVQIAPYVYEGLGQTLSARLREAQMQNLTDIPESGMAVTMDIGGSAYCIHPEKKREVGTRLAWCALAKTYGMKGISYSGPVYERSEIKGDKIVLAFSHADGGLLIRGSQGNGFEIAGSDRIFHPAVVRIAGSDRLEVSSKEVPEPKSVRYCFHNYAEGTLFNGYLLPASSFRTDDWTE